MLTAYVVLDGFDFGAGALHLVRRADRRGAPAGARRDRPVLGRQRGLAARRRRRALRRLPEGARLGLSGFYFAIFLVLWCLILRGISIEFRSHVETRSGARSGTSSSRVRERRFCPIFFGAALGNLMRGVPLDADGWFELALFTDFTAHARRHPRLVHGARRASSRSSRSPAHGAAFLAWKTDGAVRDRSRRAARALDRRGRRALGRRDARDRSREPGPSRGSAEAAPRGGAGRRRAPRPRGHVRRFSGAGGTSPRSCPPARSWAASRSRRPSASGPSCCARRRTFALAHRGQLEGRPRRARDRSGVARDRPAPRRRVLRLPLPLPSRPGGRGGGGRGLLSFERGDDMLLLNPRDLSAFGLDAPSRLLLEETIEFFERKGKRKLKDDDHERVWYADFLDFVKRERDLRDAAHARRLRRAPTRAGTRAATASSTRSSASTAWLLVHVAGLGPRPRPDLDERERGAQANARRSCSRTGAIFALRPLREGARRRHLLDRHDAHAAARDGTYARTARKYYIGNGNEAAHASRRSARSTARGEYVFFAVDSQHPSYECVQNVVQQPDHTSPSSRCTTTRSPTPTSCSRGQDAWDAALNTVNIGKYNLGWASIGICTHAFYEAITHAANRRLYGMRVTDFPHVKQMFTDAYARLVAMKLVRPARRRLHALRLARGPPLPALQPDREDEGHDQGEEVINLLWDVIAARASRRTCTSRWRRATSARCRSSRARCTSTSR